MTLFSSARSARNTFSAIPLDRATDKRDQPEWLAAIHDQSLEVLVSEDSLIASLVGGEQLRFLACADLPQARPERSYLGHFAGAHYFARTVERAQHTDLEWLDLRAVALRLPTEQAGLAAYARGLLFWHSRHRFCGVCGHATLAQQAGHKRRCVNPNCAAEHFPRTDPAIIVAVEFEGKILLGRQASWPPGRYSTLAGFVEPGESLEDALQREVFEEAGVRVIASDYFSSQPWPFPASLMLGFTAIAANAEVNVGEELESARYFSVSEFEAEIRSGHLRMPPPVSVSFRLIENWYEKHAQRSFADFLGASSKAKI
jgi:NAD+ diphosphatase